MIIFFEHGRLGNQLFQYAAMKELFPEERILFIGCSDLKRTLALVDAEILEKEKIPRWLSFGLRKVLIQLSNLRIIGNISEARTHSSYNVKIQSGLVPGLKFLLPSFFQHHKIVDRLDPKFEICNALQEKALAWIEAREVSPKTSTLVFVHIRRGDYLSWPSRKHPAILEKRWYIGAMERIRSQVDNPLFLIMTDDAYYAEDCFGDQADVLISKNNQFVDMALMALCSHGILSASSFAWWGAWFSRQARTDQTGGIYLGPRYWGGRRNHEWHPEGFISDWITYIE